MIYKARKEWSWKSFFMKAEATIDVKHEHKTADGETVPAEVLALQISRRVLVPMPADDPVFESAIDSMSGA